MLTPLASRIIFFPTVRLKKKPRKLEEVANLLTNITYYVSELLSLKYSSVYAFKKYYCCESLPVNNIGVSGDNKGMSKER